jgi:hypothetical protein
MKTVYRDVTIPLLILSIVVIFINEMGMDFDVKFLIGFSVLMGIMLYSLYQSGIMALLSALLSGNLLFVLLRYEVVTTPIDLMSFGVVIAGLCALIYNLISDDDMSEGGIRMDLIQPLSFMGFGATLYLSSFLLGFYL